MKKFNTLPALLLLLALAPAALAQISFTDQTLLLDNPAGFSSGVAVAVADMNGDGLDDIVRLEEGSTLSIEYQAAPGESFAHFAGGEVPGNAWAVAVADVNSDGFCDILAGGAYDDVKVLTAQNGGGSYSTDLLPNPSDGIFVQGANFADINNDGHLDVFACHDDGESHIWGNDGTGSFFLADDWMDMSTTPASDNSGNYGSVWTDFDNDGDNDLYIAKCRQGVDNPEDPRRINALFQNDGQNNYSEVAGKYGLKIKWQSWTADFQDIDNDGDMDCLVTNHDYPLQLLENDGAGHFTDISIEAGVSVGGTFLQGIFRDFDNDGFSDIITTGRFNTSEASTYLFRNNGYPPGGGAGGVTFTEIADPFGGTLGTLAAGDLNHDGFVDLYAAYQTSFNNPSNVPDKLWMNTSNFGTAANHFLAVSLQGVQSNRGGVGARLEIHGPWGIQIREVRSGESYGISNSLTAYFGLGAETEVEYLVVRWPSGKVDVLKNLAADQFLTVQEGSTCSLGSFALSLSGGGVLCSGQSLTMTAPEGYDYLWSNGSVSQSLTVTEGGNYRVVIVAADGCVVESDVVAVVVDPDETPTLAVAGEVRFCEGGSVTLTSSEASGYAWSNGWTTQSITVGQSGTYFVTVPGYCAEFSSATISVEALPAPAPVAEDVSLALPGSATLTATGDNPRWYDSPSATVPLATGNEFVTPVLSVTTTYHVEDADAGFSFETGMPEHQGTLFNGNTFNGDVIFDVFLPLTLRQVTVQTDSAGVRIVELVDAGGQVVQSASFDIPAGEILLDLNFSIQPGSAYRLTTNTANNEAVLGTMSPRLRRSDEGVSYPYGIADTLVITGSTLGGNTRYYYFFDWQLTVNPVECVSERVPVVVTVAPNAAGEELAFGKMSVQPNPSAGAFTLELLAAASGAAALSVSDLTGKVVFEEKFEVAQGVRQLRQVDLGSAPAGVYFLQVRSGEAAGRLKVVVE